MGSVAMTEKGALKGSHAEQCMGTFSEVGYAGCSFAAKSGAVLSKKKYS